MENPYYFPKYRTKNRENKTLFVEKVRHSSPQKIFFSQLPHEEPPPKTFQIMQRNIFQNLNKIADDRFFIFQQLWTPYQK